MSAILSLSKFFSSHPLTRDAPLGAWVRFASWQIRSRLQDEVIFDWIGGQRLAVRRGMTGATGNIYVGLHEFSDMMLALHFLRESDVFIDIGANIGSYSVLAGGVGRATVWAIEPSPDTAQALRRNVELNALQERVTVCEFAVGDYEGEVTFTRGLDTVNRVATSTDHDVQRVPMRRLDGLVLPDRPAMIKMDVEGHEEAALRGSGSLLSKGKLKVIELETVTPEIERTLRGHGFTQAFYDPLRRELTASPNGMAANNAIFVRDWDFVAARLATAPAVRVLNKLI